MKKIVNLSRLCLYDSRRGYGFCMFRFPGICGILLQTSRSPLSVFRLAGKSLVIWLGYMIQILPFRVSLRKQCMFKMARVSKMNTQLLDMYVLGT